MHDGSINRGGRRGREPAESQSAATYPFVARLPTYVVRCRAPTWTPVPLLSRVIIIPALWNTYCDPRDRYCYERVSLSLSLSLSLTFFLSRKPSRNSMKPELSREQSARSPIMQKSAIITCNSAASDPKEPGTSFRNSTSLSNSMCSRSEEIWNLDR